MAEVKKRRPISKKKKLPPWMEYDENGKAVPKKKDKK